MPSDDQLIQDALQLVNIPWIGRGNLLLLTVVGSRAYGIHTPASDWDVQGVVAPSQDILLGLAQWESIHKVSDTIDVRLHVARMWVSLLRSGSPNHVEQLFAEHRLYVSPAVEPFIQNRHLFITPGTLDAIIGNHYSTLKRFRKLEDSKHGSKRRGLMERFGFDTSSAANDLRWLWMGLALEQDHSKLHVKLTPLQAQTLREIKRGEWTAEQMEQMLRDTAADLEAKAPNIRAQLRVPRQEANDMLVSLHKTILTGRY